MRKLFFYFSVSIAGALAVPIPSVAAPPPVHWTVTNQPVHLVNGSPILFRVTTPKSVRALSGSWLGHDVAFSPDADGKSWFALAGISQETKPGSYPIALHAETSAGDAISFEKKISVARQRYPRVLLKVPGKYTAPNPDDQREIAQAKEIKADAFKTVTPDREWKGSFAPPVNAEISDVFGVERVFNGSVQSTHQGLDFRVPTGT